jgi:hypothetical protein
MEDATVVSMKGRKPEQEMFGSVKKHHRINGSIIMYFAYSTTKRPKSKRERRQTSRMDVISLINQ